ncbi:hypothetical protein pb186bvf_000670 [Paramecium bursaria]
MILKYILLIVKYLLFIKCNCVSIKMKQFLTKFFLEGVKS